MQTDVVFSQSHNQTKLNYQSNQNTENTINEVLETDISWNKSKSIKRTKFNKAEGSNSFSGIDINSTNMNQDTLSKSKT